MSEIVFQMWESFRNQLIEKHNFYIEQARKRLLSQFENISEEADQAEKVYLAKINNFFDPCIHDPSHFYSDAFEKGLEFYVQLSEMRNNTRLSVVAGMFHQWDKDLRDWLCREVKNWHRGENFINAIWSANSQEIMGFLKGFGFHFDENIIKRLDEMRLVVNVFKHGNGNSFTDLAQSCPEYLEASSSELPFITPDYTDIAVTDLQLEQFSSAILGFWIAIPHNLFLNNKIELPKKFEIAYKKDRDSRKKLK